MKGQHATFTLLDEVSGPTMQELSTMQRHIREILERQDAQAFQQYRDDLQEFIAYRNMLLAR